MLEVRYSILFDTVKSFEISGFDRYLIQYSQGWVQYVLRRTVDHFLFSRSCHYRVLRSCAECEKNFKKNTSLSGHRVRARRTKARSLAACWQRCRERPDCRFVNWVKSLSVLHIVYFCVVVALCCPFFYQSHTNDISENFP